MSHTRPIRCGVWGTTTIDQLGQLLVNVEANIARIRACQLATLQALDLAQVAMADGSRSMAEWVAARMDLTSDHAQRLTQTATRLQEQTELSAELQEGVVSFDRACEESRLVSAGATKELVAASRGFDLTGVRRMVRSTR